MDVGSAGIDAFAATNSDDMARIWHERLGHASLDRMKTLAKMGAVQGLNISNFDGVKKLSCETCIISNMKEAKFPKDQARRATRVGEILHIDGKGPFKPVGRNGFKYFLQIVDNYGKKR